MSKPGYEQRGQIADTMRPQGKLEEIDNAIEHAKKVLATRAVGLMERLPVSIFKHRSITTVWMCGGALLPGKPNDIDLFINTIHDGPVVETIEGIDAPVQIIRTKKGSLKALVDSFDFAHCKVGVQLSLERPYFDEPTEWTVHEVCISPDFAAAMIGGQTFYTLKPERAEQPKLRSLARVAKVARKLKLGVAAAYDLARQITGSAKDGGFEDEIG